MELGEKLRLARLEAGLSQRALCGDEITRNMLSRIENGAAREIVRVTGYMAGKGLIVSRAQDNTTPTSFPNGACVSVVWTPQQLLDFLGGQQAPQPQMVPATYCLDCNTCIKIEADGTISEVIGSTSC